MPRSDARTCLKCIETRNAFVCVYFASSFAGLSAFSRWINKFLRRTELCLLKSFGRTSPQCHSVLAIRPLLCHCAMCTDNAIKIRMSLHRESQQQKELFLSLYAHYAHSYKQYGTLFCSPPVSVFSINIEHKQDNTMAMATTELSLTK